MANFLAVRRKKKAVCLFILNSGIKGRQSLQRFVIEGVLSIKTINETLKN